MFDFYLPLVFSFSFIFVSFYRDAVQLGFFCFYFTDIGQHCCFVLAAQERKDKMHFAVPVSFNLYLYVPPENVGCNSHPHLSHPSPTFTVASLVLPLNAFLKSD